MEISSWVLALRGVTQLRLASSVQMDIACSLGALTRLQDLELNFAGSKDAAISVAPDVRLPTSITRLVLACDSGYGMPPQVGICPKVAAQMRWHASRLPAGRMLGTLDCVCIACSVCGAVEAPVSAS
jgi:hypothetical protein